MRANDDLLLDRLATIADNGSQEVLPYPHLQSLGGLGFVFRARIQLKVSRAFCSAKLGTVT